MANRRHSQTPFLLRWLGDIEVVRIFLLSKPWFSSWGIIKGINSVLRSLGVVAFANSPLTGALILTAMFWGNIHVGLAAVMAGVVGVVGGKFLGAPDPLVCDGVSVFNGVLVACISTAVVPSALGVGVGLWYWVILAAAVLATSYVDLGLNSLMSSCGLPAQSVAFNVVTAVGFLAAKGRLLGHVLSDDAPPTSDMFPSDDNYTSWNSTGDQVLDEYTMDVDWFKVLQGSVLAAGQVYGVGTMTPSILVWLGFLLFSPILAIIFFIGSVIGTTLAVILVPIGSLGEVYVGLWGYNSLLTAGGLSYFLAPTPHMFVASMVGAAMAVCTQAALMPLFLTTQVPVMSFPFNVVITTILAISMQSDTALSFLTVRTFHERHVYELYCASSPQVPLVESPRTSSPSDQGCNGAGSSIPNVEVSGLPLGQSGSSIHSPLLVENVNSMLFKVITLQGWLIVFRLSKIRADFIGGKMFVSENSEEMLSSLDYIRDCMVPSPFPLQLGRPVPDASSGVDFITKLIAKEDGEPSTNFGNPLPVRKTFKGWSNYLAELSSSYYWKSATSRWKVETGKDITSHHGDGQAKSTSDKDDKSTSVRPPVQQSLPLRTKFLGSWHLDVDEWCFDPAEQPSVRPKTTNLPMPQLEERLRKISMKSRTVSDVEDNRHQVQLDDDEYNRYYESPKQLDCRPSIKTDIRSDRIRNQEDYYQRRTLKTEALDDSFEVPLRTHARDQHRSSRVRDVSSRHPFSARDDYDSDEISSLEGRKFFKLFSELCHPKEAVSPGSFSGREGTSFKEFLDNFDRYFSIKYEGNDRQKSKLLLQHLDGPAKRAYEAMDGTRLNYSQLRPELLEWHSGEETSLRNKSESELRKTRMMPEDSYNFFALGLERLAARAFSDSPKSCERELCRKFQKYTPPSFAHVLADGVLSPSLRREGRKTLNRDDMLILAESKDRRRRLQREDQSTDVDTDVEEAAAVWYSRPGKGGFKSEDQNMGYDSKRHRKNVSFPKVFTNSSRTSPPPKLSSPNRSFGQPRPSVICNWCGQEKHIESNCWLKLGACLRCGGQGHLKDDCPYFTSKYKDDARSHPLTCSCCGGAHYGKDCEQEQASN